MRNDKDAKHPLGLERPNKQSEGVLFDSAVKTTIQILYDKELFDNYDNVDKVLKDYPLFEVTEKRRPDLNPTNVDDNVIQ